MEPTGRVVEVPSRRFGRYLVRARLGAGGMAEVFLTEISDGQRTHNVALKLMRKDASVEAFADEADLMTLLQHPNLVSSLEYGEAFGRPFIAMEFLELGDLRALMQRERRLGRDVPEKVALHLTTELLKGLAYFHQAKTRSGKPLALVHGDVNPSNVFFSARGEVKLGDFGVAKSQKVAIGPKSGVAAGKLRYLAPEQVKGEACPGSDLFAVGVMLYELVVGYHPFDRGETDEEKVLQLMRAPRLEPLPDRVPPGLQRILQRALAAEVDGRYQTAGDFAGELLRYALDGGHFLSAAELKSYLEQQR